MEIIGKKHLEKLKRKNQGNVPLGNAIDNLINDIESSNWENRLELTKKRPDADFVYNDFYFFDIHVHRVLILIEFADGEATIVWCGSHDEYESTFRNNKSTIKKWLKNKGFIE